jgi:hypothetical protein
VATTSALESSPIGRFAVSGFQPVNWIAADILRVEDGVLAEHWNVIQDEATKETSKSDPPIFGNEFPKRSGNRLLR